MGSTTTASKGPAAAKGPAPETQILSKKFLKPLERLLNPILRRFPSGSLTELTLERSSGTPETWVRAPPLAARRGAAGLAACATGRAGA